MNTKKPHIVFLTPGFPINEQDSRCIPALQIYIKAFLKKNEGSEVTVISLDYPFKQSCYYWNQIPIYPMNGKNWRGLKRVAFWIKVIATFSKINQNSKVTHIHSFWYAECAFIGSLISTFYNVKHINTLMGQDARKHGLYTKAIIKRPILVALSSFHAKSMVESLKILPDCIIPWGIEKGNSNIDKKTRGIDILGVGSLFPIKDFSLFIDIVSKLVKRNKELKCVIIGEGDEKIILQDKISILGISNNIKLIGGLERDEVLNYMSNSKVLLHTSSYESFGMVFIEALSVGTFVVSKPIGCHIENHMWDIGKSKNELIEKIQIKLKEVSRKCIYPFEIKETVKRYTKLYEHN